MRHRCQLAITLTGSKAPVPRVLQLTPRYRASLQRLGIEAGSDRARAVAMVIRSILDADVLPGADDSKCLMPPTGVAYVRRAKFNLWLWWKLDGDRILVVAVTAVPPVPLDT